MKLFIVPEKDYDGVYTLVAETGEGLASHWCSGKWWAKGDLEANRPERQEEWKKRFGDYKVMFLSEQTELPRITEEDLIKRNEEWFNKLQLEKTEKAETIN